jgi:hypothetical protein
MSAYMATYYYAAVGPYPTHHLTGKVLFNWQRFGGGPFPDSTPQVFRLADWIDGRIRPDQWWGTRDPLDKQDRTIAAVEIDSKIFVMNAGGSQVGRLTDVDAANSFQPFAQLRFGNGSFTGRGARTRPSV